MFQILGSSLFYSIMADEKSIFLKNILEELCLLLLYLVLQTAWDWFPKITWEFIYSNFTEVAKYFIPITMLKRFKFLDYQISFCFDVTFIIRKERKNILLLSESPKILLKWSFLTLLEISSKASKLSINEKPIHHLGAQRKALRQQIFCSLGASAQSHVKGSKIWFRHLCKKWSVFQFSKKISQNKSNISKIPKYTKKR